VHSEDRRLRRIDDGGGQHRAEHAAVADGVGAARQLLDGELAVLRALAEFRDLFLDVRNRHLVGVAQDGHDQAARAADRDADVVVAVVDDVAAVDRRVDQRELLQRVHGGLHEEAHEAELHAVFLLEAILVLVAQVDDRLHVDFVDVVRIAAVDCDCTRRSATRARSRDIGTRCSGRDPCAVGSCTTGAFAAGGAGAAGAGLADAAATSPLVMRPPRPVPSTDAGSTPCSAIILRAAGSAVTLPAGAGAGAGAAAAGAAAPGLGSVASERRSRRRRPQLRCRSPRSLRSTSPSRRRA
jgi:hypothetical protein